MIKGVSFWLFLIFSLILLNGCVNNNINKIDTNDTQLNNEEQMPLLNLEEKNVTIRLSTTFYVKPGDTIVKFSEDLPLPYGEIEVIDVLSSGEAIVRVGDTETKIPPDTTKKINGYEIYNYDQLLSNDGSKGVTLDVSYDKEIGTKLDADEYFEYMGEIQTLQFEATVIERMVNLMKAYTKRSITSDTLKKGMLYLEEQRNDQVSNLNKINPPKQFEKYHYYELLSYKEEALTLNQYRRCNFNTVDDVQACTDSVMSHSNESIRLSELATEELNAITKQLSSTSTSTSKNFTGNSDTVTEPFYLSQGLVIFHLTYSGDSNFIVYIIDANGNKENMANEIGRYSGTKSLTVNQAGNYRLGIEVGISYTDGDFSSSKPWTINIEQ